MGLMMIGSTVFAAGLADLPQPFVTSAGAIDSLVVVGSDAMVSDVAGAIDVAARLGSQSTTAVTTAGTSGVTSVATGEGKALATSNTKIYLDDNLAKSGIRNTMTATELPTLLKSGTLTGDTTYNYNQYIDFSDDYTIQFKILSSYVTDPSIMMGSFVTSPTTSTYWYKTRIVFEKDLNVTDAATETLDIFGGTYTVSSDTTSSKLVLFGSSNTVSLYGGDEVTITLDGTDRVVKLIGVEDTTHAVVAVDGVSKTVTEGSTRTINGVSVYADDISQFSTTDQTQNYVKLSVGSKTLTLEDGKKVTTGTTTTENIDGTYTSITTSDGKISMIEVYTAGKSSSEAYIKEGGEYVDPVWGTFKIAFPTANPTLTADSRDKITVEAASDSVLQVTFTDENQNEATFDFAYLSSTSDTVAELADRDGDEIIVVEGAALQLNDYVVVDAGNYGHLFEVTAIDADGSATADMELTDKFSGTTYTVTLGPDGEATKVIDGQTYYINATGSGTSGTAYIVWGTGSAQRDTGTYTTVFPRIKGKNGEYLALVDGSSTSKTANVQVSVSNGDRIQLPTGALSLSIASSVLTPSAIAMEDGTASVCTSCADIPNGGADAIQLGKTSTGGLWYNLSFTNVTTTTGTLTIQVLGDDETDAGLTGASLILVEEQDSSSNVYSVVVPASTELSGSNRVAIAASPIFTYDEDSASPRSDSYTTEYLDLYGVYAKRNTQDQDSIEIWYPDEQVTMDFFVADASATFSTGAATAGETIQQAVPVTTSIAKLSAKVTSQDKTDKNLILVGGPCVNNLVADLLATEWGVDDACSEWLNKYTTGESIIKLVEDAFVTGKSALIIAGTNADDTTEACSVFQKYDTKLSGISGNSVKIANNVVTTETA
jgi:hypothetical protein